MLFNSQLVHSLRLTREDNDVMDKKIVLCILLNAFMLIAAQLPQRSYLGKTDTAPCCADNIGREVCTRLRAINKETFERRCSGEPDFGMIQCCVTCAGESATNPNAAQLKRGELLFAKGDHSPHCFDRHGAHYCRRFVDHIDSWENTKHTCKGWAPQLAFRSCRKSCGYCRPELYADNAIIPEQCQEP